MKVVIDARRCSGHGLCLSHAPEIFEHDDAGMAVVRPGSGNDLAAAREAEQNCPERAITVEVSDD
ncbi:ferredoxin [Sporichthya brevicatena]|uniref:Ferredoxin n=1 Tax=Sporichthya brevicatena TaxID=171442 RepID=A0ABN1GNU0_9ACTN